MKYIIYFFISISLSGCGVDPYNQEVSLPITIPLADGYSQVDKSYSLAVKARVCSFRIYLSNGSELPSSSYNYNCEYDDGGMATKVIVTYYYSLPAIGYLKYYF